MVTMWLQSCSRTRASHPQQRMCTAWEPRSLNVPQVLAAAVVCMTHIIAAQSVALLLFA